MCLAFLAAILLAANTARAQAIKVDRDGALTYASDERGNRVPDFSSAGYRGGGVAIPTARVVVFVAPAEGDQTARLQAAIDSAAGQGEKSAGPVAVLLGEGEFPIAGTLRIRHSNVVLRGSGRKTVLLATGQDRRTLIEIAGRDERAPGPAVAVVDDDVPANASRLRLANASAFRSGDRILIRRPSTAEWIRQLGMDDMGGDRHGFNWKPGSRDLTWDRTVTSVEGDAIAIDAPITLALGRALGGGTVAAFANPGELSNVGIEHLVLRSSFDPANTRDEEHAWTGVALEHVRDAWVRQVDFRHFAGSAVCAWETVSRLTVEDCRSFDPVSEVGGWRRVAFFTAGQQCLFQRCFAERATHAFATGFVSAGPNVFLQCEAAEALDDSGPIDSASAGALFDNVKIDGHALGLADRQYRRQGAGWAAFNCVLWNSSAGVIRNHAPPGAMNWAFGTRGEFEGRGHWQGSADPIEPLSLYMAQLSARLGRDMTRESGFMPWSTEASSSPSPEKAAELIAASTQPAPTIERWIDDAPRRNPIPSERSDAKSIDDLWQPAPSPAAVTMRAVSVANGRLALDGQPLTGTRRSTQWWRGSTRPTTAPAGSPDRPSAALTRFVPGRAGPGFTDDLEHVAAEMRTDGVVAFEHHYGLWYDRRRDDHQRVRRMSADVAAPFFEQPFARSGQGTAYDGLSRYDLTKYNPWYFNRLRQFAAIADRDGLVLIHQHYFQHNILEAGAHYADFPWRPANNINDTGFPEPPPYAGDKRIFLAEQFYDVTHPTRRPLHRAYIRQCLSSLSDRHNVIHMTSAEYTGPLEFVQFWLDCVAEWQRETGKDVLVGLSATKDVQDAILADPARSKLIDVIDIRYWWYQENGELYAPPGGKNLAPRQWARLLKPKNASPESAARAVREYRGKFPGKAITWSVEVGPALDWTGSFAE